MKVIYFGHSCFLILFNGKKLLIDPFISGNKLANNINISDIKCDYILITHGHQDHLLDAELIGNNNNAEAKIAGITPAVFIFKGK